MKIIKKILLFFIITITIIITALITLPYVFKSEILTEIKKVANENLNAKFEFEDINLSLFSNFPALSIELKNIVIAGSNEFKNDTLFSIKSIATTVDVGDVLNNNYKINKLILSHPTINLIKLKNLKTNWDIAIKKPTTTSTTTNKTKEDNVKKTEEVKKKVEQTKTDTLKSEENIKFSLNEFKIINANISYSDFEKNSFAKIKNYNLDLSGNFENSITDILIKMSIENISYRQNGNTLVDNLKFEFNSNIKADLKNKKYTLSNNEVLLNNLKLNLNGSVVQKENGAIGTDLIFKANNTSFKTLLSFIPAAYTKQIADIETKGEVGVDIQIRGDYFEDNLPSLDFNFYVKNASVQYPKLPEDLRDINIKLKITKPQGKIDKTIINLSNFSLMVAKNPIKANFFLSNPISDPKFKGLLTCDIDLESLKKAIPIEIDLKGRFNTDIKFSGTKSLVDKKQYEKIKVKGLLTLNNIIIDTKDLPNKLIISNAKMNITPQNITLSNFKGKIGKNDFSVQGKINNYLAYHFNNETINGSLKISSKYFNTNNFLPKKGKTKNNKKDKVNNKAEGNKNRVDKDSESSNETAKEKKMEVIEIPDNINISFKTDFKKIIYDKIELTNVKGSVTVKNRVAKFNLGLNIFKGKTTVKGNYSTKNIKKPRVGFNFNLSNIDINDCYNKVKIIKQMLPIADKTSGRISMKLNFKSILKSDMQPKINTINGGGSLSSKTGLIITGSKSFQNIGKTLKTDKFDKISAKNFNLKFRIINGDIIIEPFNISISGNKAKIWGKQGIDKTMEYNINMDIKKKDLGKDISKIIDMIPGQKDKKTMPIDLVIYNTFENPKVKLNLDRAKKQAQKEATKKVTKKIKEKAKKEIKKFLKDKKKQKKIKKFFKSLF